MTAKKQYKFRVGRPTEYKKEYCHELIEFCQNGAHVYQWAASRFISVTTFKLWAQIHPKFAAAVQVAKNMCGSYYLGIANERATGNPERKYASDDMLKMFLRNNYEGEFIDVKQLNANINPAQQTLDMLSEDTRERMARDVSATDKDRLP